MPYVYSEIQDIVVWIEYREHTIYFVSIHVQNMDLGFCTQACPGYTSPGYTSPGYTSPGYTSPWYTSPGYTSPGYTSLGNMNPPFTLVHIGSVVTQLTYDNTERYSLMITVLTYSLMTLDP